ncbi:MAG: hypothetical protein CBCREVIR_1618 [Candidatus Burkholderia crenata]|nr:MAG: hypothetical protein CBCREVIR_1618 [Candidatus Burkholderia crenata]
MRVMNLAPLFRLPLPPLLFIRIAACRAAHPVDMTSEALLRIANWDQPERIWEFIVGFFKFLWALLRFLGGG